VDGGPKLPLLLGVVWYVGNAKKSRQLTIDKLAIRVLILFLDLRIDDLPGS
jgi:hypothetical protein